MKPNVDFNHLGEMVFGSVAMSYRGTSYKIHSLQSPDRLMYTQVGNVYIFLSVIAILNVYFQVFPSPRVSHRPVRSLPNRHYTSNSNTSNHSLEQSCRLDDSGASSINSLGEQSSFCSTSSDTLLGMNIHLS